MTGQAVKILRDIEGEKVLYEEQELVDALYAAALRMISTWLTDCYRLVMTQLQLLIH